MARFRGPIGIQGAAIEVAPGIYDSPIEELIVSGVIYNKPVNITNSTVTQGGITANHRISIVANQALVDTFHAAVYVVWRGEKWVISKVEFNRPRVIFTLGGIYNG